MRKRLLVVEDHDDLADVLSQWFTRRGFDIAVVQTGVEAAREMGAFDAAVVDLHVEIEDGLDVARALLDERIAPRVVFFCRGADPDRTDVARSLGVVIPYDGGLEALTQAILDGAV